MRSIDTRQGVIWQQLIRFALPIILSNFFQQLYSTVDLMIVGNYAQSPHAVGAIGATNALTILFIGMFIGISMGSTVVISQHYGRQDMEGLSQAIHTSLVLGLLGGLILTVVGVVAAEPLLRLMHTPAEQLPEAALYMRIIFWGMLGTALYNMCSGILRAVGDSTRPFYFLLVAAGTNVVFDIIFVKYFAMGVRGAALATVISQTLAAGLSLITLMRSDTMYRVYLSKLNWDRNTVSKILKIGLPILFQLGIIQISNTLIQSAVNRYGANAVEGFAVGMRIDGFFYLLVDSMNIAMTTFVAQNVGARLYDRAKQGVKWAIAMAMTIAVVVGVLIWLCKDPLYALFNLSDEAYIYADKYVLMACLSYWIFAVGDVLFGAVRGTGKVLFTLITSISTMFAFRLLWVYGAQKIYPDVMSIYTGYTSSWILMGLMMIMYVKRTDWLGANQSINEPYLPSEAGKNFEN